MTTGPLGKWWSTNCEVHGYHWPKVRGIHMHHIWPLGMNGPDTQDNTVEVCPTGHMHIHMLIDLLLDHAGEVTREQTKGFTRNEIALARRGYTEWSNAGAP